MIEQKTEFGFPATGSAAGAAVCVARSASHTPRGRSRGCGGSCRGAAAGLAARGPGAAVPASAFGVPRRRAAAGPRQRRCVPLGGGPGEECSRRVRLIVALARLSDAPCRCTRVDKKETLALCDTLRDDVLPELGVRLEDREGVFDVGVLASVDAAALTGESESHALATPLPLPQGARPSSSSRTRRRSSVSARRSARCVRGVCASPAPAVRIGRRWRRGRRDPTRRSQWGAM